MGLTKRRLEEEQEGQYSTPPDRYVCHRCVTDSLLEDILRSFADAKHLCSYCDSEGSEGAADIGVLLKEIGDAITEDYTDPANELPYENQSGGYQGEVYSGGEILEELGPWTVNEDLYADVREAFSDGHWCKRHYYSLDEYEKYWIGWMEFAEIVKHRTRYFFYSDLTVESSDAIVSPRRVPHVLGQLFQEFDWFTDIQRGTEIVRARVVRNDETPSTAAELGAPPPNLATQNRMSSAGIPMFYGSFDELTSVLETYQPHENGRRKIVLATFETTKDLRVLDLCRDLDFPSSFGVEQRWQRKVLSFLQDFIYDFSKPIDRDGKEHFEYVPTQVVTEYVRHLLVDNEGRKIDGVLYKSAANSGEQAMVIFAGPEHCGAVQDSFHGAQTLLRLVRHRCAKPSEFA